MKDFLAISDFSPTQIQEMLDLAVTLKAEWKSGGNQPILKNKVLAMIFQKPSLRTRVSFDMAMRHLGGDALYLSPAEIGLGKRESIADVARVMEGYVDAIMARVFEHEHVIELAKWCQIPVINGLSDYNHPCQAMADALTIQEKFGRLKGLNVTFIGDGNNVANSWIEASILFDLNFAMATPNNYKPLEKLVKMAEKNRRFSIDNDPYKVVNNADVINTDVWVSMGQEKEKKERKTAFALYKIDDNLLKKANNDVLVMHCLPAYRNQEIADSVFEKYQDVIFTQAENRLHVQKALLEWLLT